MSRVMIATSLLLPFAVGLVKSNLPTIRELTRRRDRESTGIRCPQCGWRPDKGATWTCSPGCGHQWNTFETRGHCPECAKQWVETACLKCGQWSRHDDWYEAVDKP
jgi:hypothetical protein